TQIAAQAPGRRFSRSLTQRDTAWISRSFSQRSLGPRLDGGPIRLRLIRKRTKFMCRSPQQQVVLAATTRVFAIMPQTRSVHQALAPAASPFLRRQMMTVPGLRTNGVRMTINNEC